MASSFLYDLTFQYFFPLPTLLQSHRNSVFLESFSYLCTCPSAQDSLPNALMMAPCFLHGFAQTEAIIFFYWYFILLLFITCMNNTFPYMHIMYFVHIHSTITLSFGPPTTHLSHLPAVPFYIPVIVYMYIHIYIYIRLDSTYETNYVIFVIFDLHFTSRVLFFFPVLGIEHKVSYILGNCSTIWILSSVPKERLLESPSRAPI
jgi:hypothetical protein